MSRVKSNQLQATIFSVILSLLLIVTIVFLVVSSWRVTKRKTELTERLRVLQAQVREAEEKNAKLKEELPRTEQPDFLEGKIREQGYKKPGEEVAVILPPESQTTRQTQDSGGFWQGLFEKIKFW